MQGFLLQVEISDIVHGADEPNAVVDFLDAEFLAGLGWLVGVASWFYAAVHLAIWLFRGDVSIRPKPFAAVPFSSRLRRFHSLLG